MPSLQTRLDYLMKEKVPALEDVAESLPTQLTDLENADTATATALADLRAELVAGGVIP